MGEYVKYLGEVIKLGTCEDLYYARFSDIKDRLPNLEFVEGNAQPVNYVNEKCGWRYRFPFPDEDDCPIGSYKNHKRGYLFEVPLEFSFGHTHEQVCVSTSCHGTYNINHKILCPGDKKWKQTCSRRENCIPFEIEQQKQVDGALWLVYRCGYCGVSYRADRDAAAKVCRAIRKQNPFRNTDRAISMHEAFYAREIIRRIIAGYKMNPQSGRTKAAKGGAK